jgi:S1-C subfamily serine protease
MTPLWRRGLIFWTMLMSVVAMRGQSSESAEALLAQTYANYGNVPHFEVVLTRRDLTAMLRRGANAAAGADREIQVLESSFNRLSILRRTSDDSWRIVSQRESENRGVAMPERTLAFSKVGTADGALIQPSPTAPQPVRMVVPAAVFFQEFEMRVGSGLGFDAVLSALFPSRTATEARTFGLIAPVREGTDVRDGKNLTRIAGSTVSGARIVIWIDEASGLIERVVETAAVRGPSSMRGVKETVYTYNLTSGESSADFDLTAGYTGAKPGIESSASFTPLEKLIDRSANDTSSGYSSGPSSGLSPGARISSGSGMPFPSRPFGTQSTQENQELTPEQMEAIVLVEGADSAGTGFITRIRDVDFVATNLHVVGGNDKIRVTTLRGAVIAVGPVFGAVGRDLAILRIEGTTSHPSLALAEDPLKTIKLGDKVAVVGNRRGGGVVTQVSGVVRGIGPDRVEVDAPFQPGNSGSPIVHIATGEVIGVASYSQRRKLDELDVDKKTQGTTINASDAVKEEQRWFGYRADAVAKWESIDQTQWRAQAKRIADFQADSEAIFYMLYGDFKKASRNVRLHTIVDRFVDRYQRLGTNRVVALQLTEEALRDLRASATTGVKELETGTYYDYFRTSLYWETSIPEQLRARADISERITALLANPSIYLARLTQ